MAGIKRKQVLDTSGTTSTKKVRLESNKSSKSISKPQPSKKLPHAREQLRTKSIKSGITEDENSFEGFSDNQESESFEKESKKDSSPTVKDGSNITTTKFSNGMLLPNHFISLVLIRTQNLPRMRMQNRKPSPKNAKHLNPMLIRSTEPRRFGKDSVSNPMCLKKKGNSYSLNCLKS